jgi:hypothetical protein
MNDDVRVTLRMDGNGGRVGALLERVHAGGIEHEAAEQLGDRVVVSHDGDRLYLYAGSEDDARAASEAVKPLVAHHDLKVTSERIERWHHEAERWEDVDVPVDEADEHADHMAEEAEESRRTGVPQWEVRVTFGSTEDAKAFVAQLESEGLHVVRRSEHVMAGANTEDDAKALSKRLQAEAPAGAIVQVDGNGLASFSSLYPFAVFGGLGQ